MRTRALAVAGAATLASTPFLFIAGPGTATPADPTVTDLGNGTSEIQYTAAGDYTFTAPSGVTKASAVLVGAGASGVYTGDSSGFQAYGGGGGGVVFVDSVDVSSPVALTVGAGGTSDYSQGGDTVLGSETAGGGGVLVGTSGAPQSNSGSLVGTGNASFILGAGGGAGGSTSDCTSGVGLTASDAAGGNTLFPAVLGEPEYGIGGNCEGVTLNSLPSPGRGGDVYTDGSQNPMADSGADGAVILRWENPPALPDTGFSSRNALIISASVAVLGALAAGFMALNKRLPIVAVNSRVRRGLKELDERLRRIGQ